MVVAISDLRLAISRDTIASLNGAFAARRSAANVVIRAGIGGSCNIGTDARSALAGERGLTQLLVWTRDTRVQCYIAKCFYTWVVVLCSANDVRISAFPCLGVAG